MCGIAALFAYRDAAPPLERGELAAMTERMRPRGPDGGGIWLSDNARVGLGARRLAIIDLTAGGNQPMSDATGELCIVFNGEIYNHAELRARLQRFGVRFRSTSDTEVLLELYRHDGERMIELLRGMFAFAIWDARARRMFVGRDPYGIKPLYVADDGATFRAASTVKALLGGGGEAPPPRRRRPPRDRPRRRGRLLPHRQRAGAVHDLRRHQAGRAGVVVLRRRARRRAGAALLLRGGDVRARAR